MTTLLPGFAGIRPGTAMRIRSLSLLRGTEEDAVPNGQLHGQHTVAIVPCGYVFHTRHLGTDQRFIKLQGTCFLCETIRGPFEAKNAVYRGEPIWISPCTAAREVRPPDILRVRKLRKTFYRQLMHQILPVNAVFEDPNVAEDPHSISGVLQFIS